MSRERSPNHLGEVPGGALSTGWPRTEREPVLIRPGLREATGDRSQLQPSRLMSVSELAETDPRPPAVPETPLPAPAARGTSQCGRPRLTALLSPADEAGCLPGERGPRRAGGREGLGPGSQGRQDTRGGPRCARIGAFQVGLGGGRGARSPGLWVTPVPHPQALPQADGPGGEAGDPVSVLLRAACHVRTVKGPEGPQR